MTDPYSVLGISSSATEDEITKAYRRLAKKYHPDLNPGNKEAERKMREVNAAYEQIKNMQHGGVSYERTDGSYGPQQNNNGNPYQNSGPFGDGDPFSDIFGDLFGGAWQQQQRQNTGSSRMHTVYNLIINRQYQMALRLLSEMAERDAEWYYYSAVANAGIENRVTALSHAREAVRMEPSNMEYRSLLSQFEQGGFTYRQSGQSYGFDMRTVGRTVIQLILAQMFCTFCCRPC